MKKIGLVGLYSIDNMGDRVICETTGFLVDAHKIKFDIQEIDAVPRDPSFYGGINKAKLFISAFLTRVFFPKLFSIVQNSKTRYFLERFAWRLRLQWHYKQVLSDCDAVVFAGGGVLKYKNQGLNYLVEQVVEICEQKNIPVMFSGVGIEGFDLDDYRCEKLKSALSSKCIKSITTRDFIEILDNQYTPDSSIHTAMVGDPAFWIPECYGVIKKQNKTSKIGINVIRGDIYQNYGNNLTPQELKLIYVKLLSMLDDKGADWILFSNGMKSDHEFGLSILKEMGKSSKLIMSAPQSAEKMVALISNFDVIFGARMHACITAYSLDIPVVGLIWNEKLARFSQLTHQRSMFFTENEIDIDDICLKLLDLENFQYDVSVRDDLKRKTKVEIDNFLNSL